MREIIESLLVSTLFNLLGVLLYFYWMYQTNYSNKIQKIALFLVTFACMIFNLFFSIEIGIYTVDLRHLPLIVGVIYGGPFVAIPLLVIDLMIRLAVSETGVMLAIISDSGLVFISLLLLRWFPNLRIRNKVIFILALDLFFSLIAVFLVEQIAYINQQKSAMLYFLLIRTFGVSIVIILYEIAHKQLIITKKIIQTEKQELVSHLAASIAHEIRNPLTTIRGFIQFMSVQEEDQKNKEYFSIVTNELDRAEKIINDYLTFAKPALNNNSLIDVEEQCKHVVDIIQPLANMNSVIVHSTLTKVYIKGDVPSFQQCLLNVMKNAIEAMEKGGVLQLTALRKNREAQIIISDTGEGMTQEQIKHLGEPYFSTKDSNGTGLGLMVVFSIIREMNGRIEVGSEKNKGTTIKITLPCVEIE